MNKLSYTDIYVNKKNGCKEFFSYEKLYESIFIPLFRDKGLNFATEESKEIFEDVVSVIDARLFKNSSAIESSQISSAVVCSLLNKEYQNAVDLYIQVSGYCNQTKKHREQKEDKNIPLYLKIPMPTYVLKYYPDSETFHDFPFDDAESAINFITDRIKNGNMTGMWNLYKQVQMGLDYSDEVKLKIMKD